VSSRWCGGIIGKYNDKSLATLTPKIIMDHGSSFDLGHLSKGRASCTHPKEKGVGWDPPIPTTNERVPCGDLEEEVGPLSHPWSEKVPGGQLGTVGPKDKGKIK
jgi:hypothetical protein